jgi:hypothetical protein
VDDARRQWLERLAAACQQVIATASEDPVHLAALGEDAAAVLAQIRSELDADALT